jgi:hypothetical protein
MGRNRRVVGGLGLICWEWMEGIDGDLSGPDANLR